MLAPHLFWGQIIRLTYFDQAGFEELVLKVWRKIQSHLNVLNEVKQQKSNDLLLLLVCLELFAFIVGHLYLTKLSGGFWVGTLERFSTAMLVTSTFCLLNLLNAYRDIRAKARAILS